MTPNLPWSVYVQCNVDLCTRVNVAKSKGTLPQSYRLYVTVAPIHCT